MPEIIVIRGSVAGYQIGDTVTDPEKIAALKKRPQEFWHAIDLPEEKAPEPVAAAAASAVEGAPEPAPEHTA